MPRGEKRKGGRPKGSKSKHTLEKEAARELLRAKVFAHFDPLLEAQIANAKGLKFLVLREKKSGKFIKRITDTAEGDVKVNPEHEVVEVWAKDPSVQAFTDLMNRALDKPAEQEQAVAVSGALEITWRQ